MTTPAYCFTTLKIDLEEKPEEIIISCHGKITAESAYMFEREVHDHAIPVSRGKAVPVINRIVFDLSNVTHIDNAGLGALLAVWTKGQQRSCNVELVNLSRSEFKRPAVASVDYMFRRMLSLFA